MAIRVANNQSLTAITALPSGVSGGAMTLLETQGEVIMLKSGMKMD